MLLGWSILATALTVVFCQSTSNYDGLPDPNATGAKLFNWFIQNPDLFQQISPDLDIMKQYIYGKNMKFVGKPHAFDIDIDLPAFKDMVQHLANRELNASDKKDQKLLKTKEEEVKRKLMSYLANAFMASNGIPNNKGLPDLHDPDATPAAPESSSSKP